MVFFIRDSTASRVRTFYPSPAGVAEAEISVDAAELAPLEPDIEALLVSNVITDGYTAYLLLKSLPDIARYQAEHNVAKVTP